MAKLNFHQLWDAAIHIICPNICFSLLHVNYPEAVDSLK